MFKGKMWLHQLVLFGVLGLIVLWSFFNGSFVFDINLLWWLLGAMIGFLFVFTDRIVYALISRPEETTEVKMKELFGKDSLSQGIKNLLREQYDQKELVMRSFLFLIVWLVLGIFTVTSVANAFARGLVLGIGTHLVFDLLYDSLTDKERLDNWFWQIKRTLEPGEKKWFVIMVTIVFIWVAFNL